RRGFPSATGVPGPVQDLVMVEMGGDLTDGTVAVARRVLQLVTDIGRGFAEPFGLDRRQLPGRGHLRRHVGDCVGAGVGLAQRGVAGGAGQGLDADAALAGIDVHAVRAGRAIARSRPHRAVIGADMAIGAARMRGDFVELLPAGKPVPDRYRAFGEFVEDPSGADGFLREGRDDEGENADEGEAYGFHDGAPQTKSTCLLNGISRRRMPVAAKMAPANAGAAGGTGGSPIPRTREPFCSPRTPIWGH